ncbi:myb-like protein F [Vanessa cardui]|uniref:myb-like protein F n=1 Tax=Vanessa cardui TaxID=171605 RepID=UPI001F12A4F1|nr:myb-like protein F [Vanessa cardui]
MPSARRRRFSVQNEIANQEITKSQHETQISQHDLGVKPLQNNSGHNLRHRNKTNPNTSKKSSALEIVTEYESNQSMPNVQDNKTLTVNKEVTASSSNINLFTILNNTNPLPAKESKENIKHNNNNEGKNQYNGNMRRDRTPRRDKYLHRIKVRSPKRKAPLMEKEIKKRSIGINTKETDWQECNKSEIEIQMSQEVVDVGENTEEEEKTSSNSLEDMCRICHSGEAVSADLGNLLSACSCRGTIGRVHVKCLEHWLTESGKSRCELCGTRYITRRVHRFGLLKALIIWILSQNSKHMIVDFLGIMIMTPIALVAAGLTGRTFAGLMAQDHLTQWPLASTFVLACMTLVCYYCWVVSALTRHALGWWIWYRSHYEVRLQLQPGED